MKRITSILISLITVCSFQSLTAKEIPVKKVQQFMQSQKPEKAIALLTDYIKDNPDSVNAYLLLGKVHLSIGNIESIGNAELAVNAGLERDPKNSQLLELAADIYHRMGFYDKALNNLERYFENDSSNQKVIERLVNYYIHERKLEKVKSMQEHVRNLVQKNPSNPFNYFMLGKLEIETGHADSAITMLKKGIEYAPNDASFHRLISEAFLWNGQGLDCTSEYYRWLELEKDPTVLFREYLITQLAMNNSDSQTFDKIPAAEKSSFLIKYWRINDTYPITAQNERLIEFMRRVTYALTFYHSIKNPLGFDEDGIPVVRWGPLSAQDALKRKKVVSAEQIEKTIYRYQESLEGIDRRLQYLPLAKYDPLVYEVFSTLQTIHKGSINYRLSSEPSYGIKLQIPELQFDSRTAQFRGDSGRTRLDLDYGFSLDQLKAKTVKDSLFYYTFETDLIVHDSLENRKLRTHKEAEFELKSDRIKSPQYFVKEERNDLAAGDYKLSFQLCELSNNKGNFIVQPLKVRDFSGGDLMLSDLKLCEKVDFKGINEKTGLDELSIMPYPFSSVKKANQVFLYFEVYNLLLEPGKNSTYTVSFTVYKQDEKGYFFTLPFRTIGRMFSRGKPTIIEITNERESTNSTSIEYIQLDLASLETGHSWLTVSVEDKLSNRKDEKSIEFELEN